MLTDSTPTKTSIFVKSSKGTFGPYPSRMFAEQMVMNGQIPKNPNELPQIVERYEDGKELLLG